MYFFIYHFKFFLRKPLSRIIFLSSFECYYVNNHLSYIRNFFSMNCSEIKKYFNFLNCINFFEFCQKILPNFFIQKDSFFFQIPSFVKISFFSFFYSKQFFSMKKFKKKIECSFFIYSITSFFLFYFSFIRILFFIFFSILLGQCTAKHEKS